MADLLIYARPDNNPYDPDQSKRGHAKGGIVVIQETGAPWGGADGPPDFVRLTITDRTKAQVIQYIDRWDQLIDFRVDQHNPTPNDRYDVAVIAVNKRASDGFGGLTRDKVETYLNGWNVTTQSAGQGEVNTRFFIGQVASSSSFFEADVSAVVFAELSYDSGTGVHQIQADYSATSYNSTAVQARVESLANVVSHANSVIVYEVGRAAMLANMKNALRDDVEEWVAKRMWYFAPSEVDAAMAAGGIVSRTAAQVAPFLLDALAD